MPRFSLTPLLILALLPFSAHAEVFRCQKDGTTVFSDKPCATDAQAYTPKPIQVMPATKAPDLAKQYDQRTAKETKARDKDNEAWNKDYQAKKQQEETIRDARVARKAVVGMSQQQVRDMLGNPQVTSHNENLGVVREGWTYKNPDGSRDIVYFKDGVVTNTSRKSGK
jgi:hypothetical protein